MLSRRVRCRYWSVCGLGLLLLTRGLQAEPPQPATPTPAITADRAAASELDGADGRDLSLRQFDPRPLLQLPRTPITAARYPVVDVHTHFYHKLRHNDQAFADFIQVMDRNGIAICVSLDGRLGDQLDRHLDFLQRQHRDRFVVFANVDWQGDGSDDQPGSWACLQPGFAQRTADQLAEAVGRGVAGLKVFKSLGLQYRDGDGRLLMIDDPRWDPIWRACGQLGIPVLIHAGDPAAFFQPVDRHNERWEELSRNPSWSFQGGDFPTLDELLQARNRVVQRHPETTFIAAHLASCEHDLQMLSAWLEQYPNLYVDIASRINELGRVPQFARQFLIRHSDRVLFGSDGPWPEARLNAYWRFLETRDEAFAYSEKSPPPQGLWSISGVELPDEVLRKVYYENAARIIPGVQQRLDQR